MNWRGGMRLASPLIIVSSCLFWQAGSGLWPTFREFQTVLLSVDWMLLVCLGIWCGTFIFLKFNQKDWPLLGLLFLAFAAYAITYTNSSRVMDVAILLACITLGKAASFALVGNEVTRLISKPKKPKLDNQLETPYVISYFLVGLIVLLAFSSWWHLDMAGAYHGPRWMGLWNNPNIYGMLMGAGVVLAIGLLIADRRWPMEGGGKANPKVEVCKLGVVKWKLVNIFLLVAAGMLAVGLVMSYSRGAWTATVAALLYLAWSYGKLKWRFVLPVVLVVVMVVAVFWHATSDTATWYLKRLDLSRPSAQHRVSAWRGAVQMMRDHPLGVGWNQAVSVYDKNYSPPEGGAAALTMNSYLMLGTELGLPGLLCFVAYVGLCFKVGRVTPCAPSPNEPSFGPPGVPRPTSDIISLPVATPGGSPYPVLAQPSSVFHPPSSNFLAIACRAGALVFVVAFWFDGGLFDLPTAAMFWVLLELGKPLTRP